MIITLSSYKRNVVTKIKTDKHYQFSLEECIKEGVTPTIISKVYSLMETYEYSFGGSSDGDIVKKSLAFFDKDNLIYSVNVVIPPDDQGYILGGYLKDPHLSSILSGRIKE